jgi:tetratricopeptide (TPR) repeat protein
MVDTKTSRTDRRTAVLAALALVAAALVGTPKVATAQDHQELEAFERAATNEQEVRLLELYAENRVLTARREAAALLEENPASLVGQYVMGRIMHESEGSLPMAMYHLGRARSLYEDRWLTTPRPPDAPWELHRELLYAIQSLALEMEQYEYQLEIIDFYDALYDPDLTAERAWPLMALGRIDEAREYATRASQLHLSWQRTLGLNTLCAIEGEAQTREPRFEACMAALDLARRRAELDPQFVSPEQATNVATHAYNAAGAALSVLRYDEAERIALEGTRRLAFTTANPWRFLVRLYTTQGRMEDAVNALREMRRWRVRQPANLRSQDDAETKAAFATVLLVAAETEVGLDQVTLAIQRPDRRGLTSTSVEQALGAHALLRRALRRTHQQILAERATYDRDDLPGRDEGQAEGEEEEDDESPGLFRQLSLYFDNLGDEERIISVLSENDERLYGTFRVYVQGGIEPVPTWLLGDLVEVLGPGVVSVVLREVRRREDDEQMTPFYDAIEAEVALAQGDEMRAVRLAQTALDGLPRPEVLLRARVAAIGAEAARRAGNDNVALGLFEQAMQLDPGTVRRLGLRIPAVIDRQSDDAVAVQVAENLEDSPRLTLTDLGFVVRIAGSGPQTRVCLLSASGAPFDCAQLEPEALLGDTEAAAPTEPLPAEVVASLVTEAFYDQIFAMPLGLSAVDMNSLDGSVTVSEEAARERLENVLDAYIEADR